MGSQLNSCEVSGSDTTCDTNCFNLDVTKDQILLYACCHNPGAETPTVPPSVALAEALDERIAEPTFSRTSDAKLQAYIVQKVQNEALKQAPDIFEAAAERAVAEGAARTLPESSLPKTDKAAGSSLSSVAVVLDKAEVSSPAAADTETVNKVADSNVHKSGTKSTAKKKATKKPAGEIVPQDPTQREVLRQKKLGPQSRRGVAPWFQADVLDHYPHARECFDVFERNEESMCGEWAAFYHSYNTGALLYELNTVIFSLLFGSSSTVGNTAPIPRLFVHDFEGTPDAASLKHKFKTQLAAAKHDHEPEFRAVAISAMCSLVALGPEASTPVVFVGGYSHADNPVNFRKTLSDLLYDLVVSHHCPNKKKASIKKLVANTNILVDKIIKIAEKHGLDVSGFGGKPCPSGKAGHLLQLFIKRDHVDELTYASEPWGAPDAEREPLSKWLGEDTNTNWGQARIVAHPERFMKESYVRTYVASADPLFHKSRGAFQLELTDLIREELLSSAPLKQCAATAVYGGKLPAGWTVT